MLAEIARATASIYPWMQSHKVVGLSLIVLALFTLSPLWYPSRISPVVTGASTVRFPHEKPVERSKEAAPPRETKRDFQDLFLVVKGELPFDAHQVATAIEHNPDFGYLKLSIADDPILAAAILELSCAPSGDFLYELRTSDTGAVLLSGSFAVADGSPPTVTEVAADLVHKLKPWRLE